LYVAACGPSAFVQPIAISAVHPNSGGRSQPSPKKRARTSLR
jgi:hypothetical protein